MIKKIIILSTACLFFSYAFSAQPCGVFTQVTNSPFPTGNDPIAVAFSPLIGTDLYAGVANEQDNSVSVYSVNPSNGAFNHVMGSPFGAGNRPASIAFSPLIGTDLYAGVANEQDNTVSVYSVNPSNGAFNHVMGSPFATGNRPISIAFSPLIGTDTLYAAVANNGDNTVSVYSVNPTNGAFNPVTGSPFPAGNTPVSIAFSPLIGTDTLYAAVANNGDNTVSVYSVNPTNGAFNPVTGSPFPAGNTPVSIAFSPLIGTDTLYAAVANNNTFASGSVSVYSVETLGPTVSIMPTTQTVCLGSTINFTAQASGGVSPYSYKLTSPARGPITNTTGNFSLANATSNDAGSYTVTATDYNGCISPASARVSVIVDKPTVSILPTTQTVCLGGTISFTAQATGGVSPYSYSLFTPARGTITNSTGIFSLANAQASDGGSYTVVVVDHKGCMSPDSPTVSVFVDSPIVSLTPTTQTVCLNGTISFIAQASGGVAPYSYALTTPARGTITNTTGNFSLADAQSSDAGSYTVIVTDNNTPPCTSPVSASVSVTVAELPTVSITPTTQTVCLGSTINFTAQATGGVAPYSYALTTPARGTITNSTGSFSLADATSNDAGSYTVTVTDHNGCISPASPAVSVVVDSPIVSLTPTTQTVCLNGTISFIAQASGGVAPYSYALNSPARGTITNLTGIFSLANAQASDGGSYTVTVTDSNTPPCTSASASVSVIVDQPTVSILPTKQNVCLNSTINFTAQASGGVAPYSYTLTTPARGTITNSTGSFSLPNATSNDAGNYSVMVTDSNTPPCTSPASASVSVTVAELPTVSITPTTQTVCLGSTINFAAQANGGSGTYSSFAWSTPARGTITTSTGTLSLTDAQVSDAGNYTVVVTDSNGCSSIASAAATVVVNQIPVVSISSQTTVIFDGESVTFTAVPSAGVPPYELIWSDGFVQTNVTGTTLRSVRPSATTTYSVVVVDSFGCKSDPSLAITITVLPASERSNLSEAIRAKYCQI